MKKNNPKDLAIIGLGNPGSQYEGTRHNVGFQLIELLKEQLNLSYRTPWLQSCQWAKWDFGQGSLYLVKPLTYMNRSGVILPWLMKKFSLTSEQLVVAVDNMDLIPGRVRVKPKGSSAGHNGLKSIISTLGSGDFSRIYIGVGRPEGIPVVEYVLGRASTDHQALMDQSIMRAAEIIKKINDIPCRELWDEINRS